MLNYLNLILYGLGGLGSISAGVLMYDGLSSREEKRRNILMAKRRLKSFQIQAMQAAAPQYLDEILKAAGNPLRLNAFRYQMYRYGAIGFFLAYYFLYPVVIRGQFSVWGIAVPFFLLLLSSPKIPVSAFSFIIRKLTDINISKRNNEIFQLHDLLISEIELMESRQVNTYHTLKRLYKYFDHIQPELQELLEPNNWKDNPEASLKKFGKQIGTTEAHMLVNILAKFDQHTNREVAIASLENNSKLFATKQIESYRMRRKLVNDLALIPIFTTHMLIVLNFIAVVVILTMNAMDQSNL